jgi:hypothetical protein
VRLTLVRSATLILELGGRRILVDPMLDDQGARPPIGKTANQGPQPDHQCAASPRGSGSVAGAVSDEGSRLESALGLD